jgi:ERO1-like protein alpha
LTGKKVEADLNIFRYSSVAVTFCYFFWGLQLDLQRNEVIALVNLLSRLSESLELVHEVANDIKTSNKLLGRVSSGGLGLPNESKTRWFLREADESVKSLQSLFEGM